MYTFLKSAWRFWEHNVHPVHISEHCVHNVLRVLPNVHFVLPNVHIVLIKVHIVHIVLPNVHIVHNVLRQLRGTPKMWSKNVLFVYHIFIYKFNTTDIYIALNVLLFYLYMLPCPSK